MMLFHGMLHAQLNVQHEAKVLHHSFIASESKEVEVIELQSEGIDLDGVGIGSRFEV